MVVFFILTLFHTQSCMSIYCHYHNLYHITIHFIIVFILTNVKVTIDVQLSHLSRRSACFSSVIINGQFTRLSIPLNRDKPS